MELATERWRSRVKDSAGRPTPMHAHTHIPLLKTGKTETKQEPQVETESQQ